jgi:hypothetical protein
MLLTDRSINHIRLTQIKSNVTNVTDYQVRTTSPLVLLLIRTSGHLVALYVIKNPTPERAKTMTPRMG